MYGALSNIALECEKDVRSGVKDVQVTLKYAVKTNSSFRLSQAAQFGARLWW